MEVAQKSDLAYAAIKQAIIEKALAPGTKLPEDTLGGHLGMSRTLIRAALARLAAEGLVDQQPNRGATVAQPSVEEAHSVFEVRRALEAEVVQRVVERWKPACGHALEAHVRQEEQAARQGQPAASARLAGEFHTVLAEQAGNPLLARYTSEVVSRCSLILAVHGRPHSSECAVAEHRGLIDALRSGDAKAARRLMAAHLASVQARTLPAQAVEDMADLGSILGRYLPEPQGVPAKRVARKRAGR
jgi:DNA-binding GntR family transcriptional regulator